MPISQLKIVHPEHRGNKRRRVALHTQRRKKNKRERYKLLLKRLAQTTAVCVLLGGLFIVGVFAYFSHDLPDPNKINERNVAESTKIYDRTGETLLYTISGDQFRTVIPLEEIPDSVKWATLMLEDRNFYHHKGVVVRGIVRSVWTNLTRGTKVSGSSITQQFVKNSILSSEKTYSRKIKEVILAVQMERKFTKDQILQLYLNEIPYGSTAYGIEATARIYYGKSARDLTVGESATLAALPQSPSYYYNHQDELQWRRDYALDLMAEAGRITHDEASAAKKEDVALTIKSGNILAPHFVFYVKEILTTKYGENTVERGGLTVYTTLDLDKQEKAEKAIENGVAKIEQYGGNNAALVSLDTKSGQILAMVGSRDYFNDAIEGQVNVTLTKQQPGSSFKPVVYAAAFEKGYVPEMMLFDVETTFKNNPTNWTPHNYDLSEHGPISAHRALAGSLNIPTAKMAYLTGVDNIVRLAKKMGYTTLNDSYGLAFSLGVADVRLLDHVAAFSVFAREGEKHRVTPILRVEDKKGKVLEEFKDETVQVIDKEVARKINNILSDDSARSYAFGAGTKLTLRDRPVAVKTGTTQDYRDAWTIGYTPSLATAVWAGNTDNTEMKRGAAGFVLATPIWNEYMNAVLGSAEDTPVESFNGPAYTLPEKPIMRGEIDALVPHLVDRVTGKAIPATCADTYPQDFVEVKELKETHTILHYVQKDDPLGDAPANPQDDEQYALWEEAVQRWAAGQSGYYTETIAEEDCDLRDEKNMPTINITQPQIDAVIANSVFATVVDAHAAAGRSVKRVELFLHDEKIATLTEVPFSHTHTTSLANGIYALKAVVYDDVENSAEAAININIKVEASAEPEATADEPTTDNNAPTTNEAAPTNATE